MLANLRGRNHYLLSNQVNGDWATSEPCDTSSRRSIYQLPGVPLPDQHSPRLRRSRTPYRQQYSSSVTSDGTVYFVWQRNSEPTGSAGGLAQVVRLPNGGSEALSSRRSRRAQGRVLDVRAGGVRRVHHTAAGASSRAGRAGSRGEGSSRSRTPIPQPDFQAVPARKRTTSLDRHRWAGVQKVEAIISAIAIVGRLVFARGVVGKIDASATTRPSVPWTRPVGDTTADRSSGGPIRHVPTGCQ